MFFIDGLRIGVMPLGENIGSSLPARAHLWLIFAVACILGTTANMAEPAIAALRILARISPAKAPLLFDYLNVRTDTVLWVLSLGVGVGACHGIYRLVRGWTLKMTILPVLGLVFLLTALAGADEHASTLLGVAWDAGGITTGTVTAPLLLALGVGIATALGKNHDGMAGFGIITVCSIWPIALFLGMGLYHSWTGEFMSVAECDGAGLAQAPPPPPPGDAGDIDVAPSTIGQNLVSGERRDPPADRSILLAASSTSCSGSRSEASSGSGRASPSPSSVCSSSRSGSSGGSPRWATRSAATPSSRSPARGSKPRCRAWPPTGATATLWGKLVVMVVRLRRRLRRASLAEPALAALGMTVEDVTAGAFKRSVSCVHTVAFGVGIGPVIGVAKILFGWPALWIVIPSYGLVLLLTIVSDEKYVNIGWDSGGVTTGDITSPVLIALGLGVAAAVGAADGFSLIAMGSVWPIIAVLGMGILAGRTTPFLRKRERPSGARRRPPGDAG